jgi:hypothetical protein
VLVNVVDTCSGHGKGSKLLYILVPAIGGGLLVAILGIGTAALLIYRQQHRRRVRARFRERRLDADSAPESG